MDSVADLAALLGEQGRDRRTGLADGDGLVVAAADRVTRVDPGVVRVAGEDDTPGVRAGYGRRPGPGVGRLAGADGAYGARAGDHRCTGAAGSAVQTEGDQAVSRKDDGAAQGRRVAHRHHHANLARARVSDSRD